MLSILYADCRKKTFMLSVVMLNVDILRVFMLSVDARNHQLHSFID